jgi:VanZ family protein
MQKLLLLAIALIVYGSLYPWEFTPRPLPSLVQVIRDSWETATLNRFIVRDLCVNVALYMPVGMLGPLAFSRAGKLTRYIAPVLIAAVLSTSVEIAQLFTPRRYSSVVDIAANTAGAAIGVALAGVLRPLSSSNLRRQYGDWGAIILLLCGFAYLFFPFFPIYGRAALRHKLHVLAVSPWFEPVAFASSAIAWFLAGRLLGAAKIAYAPAWLALAAAAALPGQILVLSREPVLPHVIGAAVGVILFCAWHNRASVRFDAFAAWSLLLLRGLVPFRFAASANAFTWSPFGGVLAFNDWQRGALILLEKSFFYGAALWTMDRAGAGLWKATAITTGTLAIIEAAQVYLPGRTPEITDIVLPVIIGAGSYWAGRQAAEGKA